MLASAGLPADLPPITLRHLMRHSLQFGVDPAVLCDGLGFTPADLEDAGWRVSPGQCVHVIRRFLVRAARPALGLRLGTDVNPVSWGLVALGFMACGTSRALLDFAIEHQRQAGRLAVLHGQAGADAFYLVARAGFVDPGVSAFVVEETFAAMVQMCRRVVGRHFYPRRVDLVMERPVHGALYEEAFLCPVQFGQLENRVHFPAHPYAVDGADPVVLQEVRARLAAGPDAGQPESELEAAVLQVIRRDLAHPPPLAELAAALHTSERTLRRRLGALGQGYAGLISDERRSRALALIVHSSRSLHQIAIECGFADLRTLQRAVKRWTGDSPTELRRKARAGAAPPRPTAESGGVDRP